MHKITRLIITGSCAALLSANALAESVGMPNTMPKSYTAECASCHIPYAPGLLPSKSWLGIMHSLDKHYGTDASIDAQSVTEISAWLDKYSSGSRKFSEVSPDYRISSSAWFARKHREVRKDVWLRTAIKSRANCSACHKQAAQGDFDEDNVRIPK
ncbi:MAG: cytochrome C [Glaciimonas sp.]|nr:cytochrome C [Glaciimonas sp.]